MQKKNDKRTLQAAGLNAWLLWGDAGEDLWTIWYLHRHVMDMRQCL